MKKEILLADLKEATEQVQSEFPDEFDSSVIYARCFNEDVAKGFVFGHMGNLDWAVFLKDALGNDALNKLNTICKLIEIIEIDD